jgi:nucleoside-diphosphate-sugar epimerase
MKILLTGAYGFLGSSISKRISKRYKLIKTDISNLNINKKKDIKCYFDKHKFDLVVHCAAAKSAIKSLNKPLNFFQTNFIGTLNLLEIMRKNNCKKIVFISTSGLYRNGKREKKENSKIFCKNPYSLAKYLSEELIKHYCEIYNFHGLCIRPNLISGYGLFKDNLIYDTVKDIKKYKKAFVFGKGSHLREFTHPDDISEFIFQMVSKQFEGFSIFNISNNRIKIISLIKKIIFFMKQGKINFIKPKNKQAFSLILSNKKIFNTGWRPKKNINYIIKEIIRGVNHEN